MTRVASLPHHYFIMTPTLDGGVIAVHEAGALVPNIVSRLRWDREGRLVQRVAQLGTRFELGRHDGHVGWLEAGPPTRFRAIDGSVTELPPRAPATDPGFQCDGPESEALYHRLERLNYIVELADEEGEVVRSWSYVTGEIEVRADGECLRRYLIDPWTLDSAGGERYVLRIPGPRRERRISCELPPPN